LSLCRNLEEEEAKERKAQAKGKLRGQKKVSSGNFPEAKGREGGKKLPVLGLITVER